MKKADYKTLSLTRDNPLITRLLEKKKLLANGNTTHKKIKTALIVGSGAMRGIYGAGVVNALHQLGLDDVFDVVISVSSGGIACCYFLSGQAEIAPEIFYKDLATKKFIDIRKIPRVQQVVGIDYGYEVFHTMKPLRQDAIRKKRSKYYMAVTNAGTGKGEFIDVKKSKDIIEVLHASSAIPILYWRTAMVDGIRYYDGNISCGIPVDFALQKGCTDILVVLNDPIGEHVRLSSLPFLNLFLYLYKLKPSSALHTAIHNIKTRYYETLQIAVEARKNGVNIGIIAPQRIPISPFSIDTKRLKEVADSATKQTIALFLKGP